jgi:hypothetical protein
MLTIASGYDPGYLTRSVATGRENYYLSAVAQHGEPPGIWTGRGCPDLGLAPGSQVDSKVMERLYGAFADPRDPAGTATLGRAPSSFAGNADAVSARITALLAAEPDAVPERQAEIIAQAMRGRRATVFFFDATFSVPKSVSLLHASLQVRAQQAEAGGRPAEAARWTARAGEAWDAIMAANTAMLEYLQREAGYSRAGYHSANSGRFVDAHDWVIASFAQHTSRDHDPQLHVHNAILNRVRREDPLATRPGDQVAWRTLDGTALYAAKPAAGAIADRVLAEELAARLGVRMVARPDGNGWEVAGVSQALRERFSSRRRAIEPRVRQLAEEYERRHGVAPHARALWSMAQLVTLDSRRAKEPAAPAREALLARWEEQSRRAETDALSAIPGAALGQLDPSAPVPELSQARVSRVLAAAVADAQRGRATFSRYELTRMISRHLPAWLGGMPGARITRLLEELTDRALAPGGPGGVVALTAPEMVAVPAEYRRPDGLSLWRRHGAEVYCTRAMLDTEARLLHAAAQHGAPAIAPEPAARAVGADRRRIEARLWREHGAPGADLRADSAAPGTEAPLSGAGLADDPAQAVYGILTSGRAIDILIGPAGSGKTRAVARLAQAWRDAGAGRVIGLTTSTNAAHVLAGAGLGRSRNLAEFLGRIKDSDATRGHLPVYPGDLLIIDEASLVPTADLAAVEQIATRCGAKILLTGDPAQLSAPQAGGAMRLLADEHGYYQLSTVQRFEHDWERDASVRLRAGDAGCLAEYARRGRILSGTREQMAGAACRRWLADYLSGTDSLLLAVTNSEAAELGRRARDELAALGLVATDGLAELADGNQAGTGDLIVARQNIAIDAGEPGRRLANRDVLRIDGWVQYGRRRVALVRRRAGTDPRTGEPRWSAEFELPEAYLEQHADLGYAGNVHVSEGRTVATGHLVVDDTAGRESVYVGMTRGRARNTAYVVTTPARAADLRPQPRAAPAITDPDAEPGQFRHHDPLAVLAIALEREQAEQTATATMRRELEGAASLAALAPMWTDITRTHAARRHEAILRALLPGADCARCQADAERGTLFRLLRVAELAGHDADEVLRRAVTSRELDGARSVAAVLHSRVRRIVGTPEPLAAASYAARTPAIADPQADRLARDLAAAMDDRMARLGDRVAADRPAWALAHLGEVPADPVARAEWTGRAAVVAAYREERGYARDTDPIGPAPHRASPELRASWYAAFTALRLPGENQEITAAEDGQLWAWRAAYERDMAWAPPYVADQLRDAHLAEDEYRAEAVLAWHRADATAYPDGRERAEREAAQYSALAQEVGARREALTEIDQARQQWLAATETDRQRAVLADAELRRRHPDTQIPLLEPDSDMSARDVAESSQPGASPGRQHEHAVPDASAVGVASAEPDAGRGAGRINRFADTEITAALATARKVTQILAERHGQADAALDSDDVMRRREAIARHEAAVRRAAVRQDSAPSRHANLPELEEHGLEAGQ